MGDGRETCGGTRRLGGCKDQDCANMRGSCPESHYERCYGCADCAPRPSTQERKRKDKVPALNTALIASLLKLDKETAAELSIGPLLVRLAREIIAHHDKEASSYPDTAGFTCGCQHTCEPLESALLGYGLKVRT